MEQSEAVNLRDFLLTISSFLMTHDRSKDAAIIVEAAYHLFSEDELVLRTLAYVRLTSGDAYASMAAFDQLKRRKATRNWHPLMKALYGMALSANGRTIEAATMFTALAAARLAHQEAEKS